MQWGYNLPPLGKVDQFSEGLSNSLSDSLVADMNKIKAGSERSIIFVAHGLGGSKSCPLIPCHSPARPSGA